MWAFGLGSAGFVWFVGRLMQHTGGSMYIVQHMHSQSCVHSFCRQESVQLGMGKGWGKPLSRFALVSCPRGCCSCI